MGSVIDATGVAEYGLLIDGRWRRAARCFERHNPARPAEVVGRSAAAAPGHVEDAYAAATAAAAGWAGLPATRRGEILGQAADLVLARESDMAATLTFEVGKAIRDARAEVRRSAAILRYFAGECLQPLGAVYPSATPGTLLHSVREPLGVVCAITPWNFPLAIPAWKLAPALAFGNTVVWKPAEIASGSAALLAIALTDAGLPPGVLNLITGPAASIGDAVIGHPAAAAITFTGSNAVGRRIAVQAAERGAKFQLELGGKNPVVVLPDADLERAVECTVRGAMLSTGQRCTATSRAIVVGERHDEFGERLSAAVEGLVVGDPFDEATDVGPLASAAQHQTVRSYLEIARRAGHRLACGGGATDPQDGYYVDPTVYLDVDPGSRIARDEIFGPVLAVMRARDLDAALAIANASEYGLSASVFTRDLGAALAFARRVHAGVVHVNGETAGAEPQVPFGGMKSSSSHSREQGKAALEFFTDVKTVYLEAA
jgi:acyl-CoA reductase-like NAD-dependent aldehyde dehydrogenase